MKRFAISEADFVEAARLHRGRLVPIAVNTVAFAAIVLVVHIQHSMSENPSTLVFIIACVVAALGVFLLLPWLAVKKLRSGYAATKHMQETKELSFDSQGISISGEQLALKIRWDDLPRVKQNAKLLLLYQANGTFVIVPKSAFDDDRELADFMALAMREPANHGMERAGED